MLGYCIDAQQCSEVEMVLFNASRCFEDSMFKVERKFTPAAQAVELNEAIDDLNVKEKRRVTREANRPLPAVRLLKELHRKEQKKKKKRLVKKEPITAVDIAASIDRVSSRMAKIVESLL